MEGFGAHGITLKANISRQRPPCNQSRLLDYEMHPAYSHIMYEVSTAIIKIIVPLQTRI